MSTSSMESGTAWNVVTSRKGVPHAVLLRALEPVEGITDKTWGPGLLCRAMGVDRLLNGTDLCADRLWLERPRGSTPPVRIGTGPRIGVDYAGHGPNDRGAFSTALQPYVSTASARLRRGRSDPATPLER